MEPITAPHLGQIALIALALALAAIAYDRWITRLEAAGQHHGYVSLLVAAGVAVILLAGLSAAWPLGPAARTAILITAGLCLPAGLPMILGSIRRHITARSRAEADLMAEAREIILCPPSPSSAATFTANTSPAAAAPPPPPGATSNACSTTDPARPWLPPIWLASASPSAQ